MSHLAPWRDARTPGMLQCGTDQVRGNGTKTRRYNTESHLFQDDEALKRKGQWTSGKTLGEEEDPVEDFTASVRCALKRVSLSPAMGVETTLAFSSEVVARSSLTCFSLPTSNA